MCTRSLRPMALLFTATALVLADPEPSLSQQPTPVEIGARVRLRPEGAGQRWVVGQLLAVSEDSVRLLAGDPPDSVALGLPSLASFDVSMGQRRQTGRGAMIGLGIGAVAGILLGASTGSECDDCFSPGPGPGESAVAGGVLFGALGAGIGALIGRSSQGERWEAVPQPWSGASVR